MSTPDTALQEELRVLTGGGVVLSHPPAPTSLQPIIMDKLVSHLGAAVFAPQVAVAVGHRRWATGYLELQLQPCFRTSPGISPEAGDSLLCQAGWLAVGVGWGRAHDYPLCCLCYVPGPGGMLTLNGLIIVGGRTG